MLASEVATSMTSTFDPLELSTAITSTAGNSDSPIVTVSERMTFALVLFRFWRAFIRSARSFADTVIGICCTGASKFRDGIASDLSKRRFDLKPKNKQYDYAVRFE